MADSPIKIQKQPWLRSMLVTLAIVAVYAAVMVCTNTRFTILDDESMIIQDGYRPVADSITSFLAGQGTHEMHPPGADVALHLWIVATHGSFFALRIFANLFYIAGVLCTAIAAAKIAGRRAYWVTLLLGFTWPFAFQYGRIAGWYCLSFFLVSWVTWLYLRLLDDSGNRIWFVFAVASVLFVWTNYFAFAIFFVLLADLLLFHRALALRRVIPLLGVVAAVAAAFFPVVRLAFRDLASYQVPLATRLDLRNEFASAAYPTFAIFGSVAVAPWYLPLSIPVALAVLALLTAIWLSPGRRWLVYFVLLLVALDLGGQYNIKRVLFLLPWLFIAISMAVCGTRARRPGLALAALAVIVACGWVGILSGHHYATTNLYEPWDKVAAVVAADARHGATIVSGNPPFLFYLDYQLGREPAITQADAGNPGESVNAAQDYKIFGPGEDTARAPSLHGKVVVVNGSGYIGDVQAQSDLEDALRLRCATLGEFHAAPDPAAAWKQRFTKGVPILAYRTQVSWFDCP